MVLGCGSGKEVEYLLQNRPADYVCGLDFSHQAIKLARDRCGIPDRLALGDFYDLDVPELWDSRQFDSIVANAAFVHLKARDDINELLQKVSRRLTPGGLLFLRCLFKEQAGRAIAEEVHESRSDGFDSQRWFVYYSRAELADRCKSAGFEVDDTTTEQIVQERGLVPGIALEKGIAHEHTPEFTGHASWPGSVRLNRSRCSNDRRCTDAARRRI